MTKETSRTANILKTTVELPQPLADQVMIRVYKEKIKNRKFSMKQFITEAIQEKMDREGMNENV